MVRRKGKEADLILETLEHHLHELLRFVLLLFARFDVRAEEGNGGEDCGGS